MSTGLDWRTWLVEFDSGNSFLVPAWLVPPDGSTTGYRLSEGFLSAVRTDREYKYYVPVDGEPMSWEDFNNET